MRLVRILVAGLFVMGGFARAEDHSRGNGGLFNLSRPVATSSSSKKLSDLVSACIAGRNSVADLGGLADVIQSGGVGNVSGPPIFPPVDTGVGSPAVQGPIAEGVEGGQQAVNNPPPSGNGSASAGEALFTSKCARCHDGRKPIRDNARGVKILQGSEPPPSAEMANVISGLSQKEKDDLISFLQTR